MQAVVFSSRNILSNAVRAFISKPDSFCIMVDGTWKFHYGGWVLVTVGTTSLGWNSRYGGLSNTFRPIAYCFSSTGENTRAVEMLLEAVKFSCNRLVYSPVHALLLPTYENIWEHLTTYFHILHYCYIPASINI